MIGLDTNIIVHYIMQDDTVQSALATAVLERLNSSDQAFISVVTVVETAWVLERAYNVSDREIANIIEHLLQVDVLCIESEQEVFTAMNSLKNQRGAFADALIGELGLSAKCSHTLTFDKKASRLSNFKLLI